MTIDVGDSDTEAALGGMLAPPGEIEPITAAERLARIDKAQALMRNEGITALYLDASTSLYDFTGLKLGSSERLHGAVLPARGEGAYICPAFEEAKTRAMLVIGDDVRTCEEHEDPTALVVDTLRDLCAPTGTIAVDEATPFFTFDGLRRAGKMRRYQSRCRI